MQTKPGLKSSIKKMYRVTARAAFYLSVLVACTLFELAYADEQPQETECSAWLVEDVQDAQIISSTPLNDNYGPERARLSTVAENNLGGAWMPQSNDGNQFIQVRFVRMKTITSFGTKGRASTDQWVTQYRVHYSLDGIAWTTVRDIGDSDMIFGGNTDRDTLVVNQLPVTVEAKYIRISPVAWKGRIAMRFDVQGCNDTDVCNSEPCQNGGTCDSCIGCEVDYICHCPSSFRGRNCEKDIAECSAGLVEGLQDAEMTSSTQLNDNYRPEMARLSTVGGAWIPQRSDSDQFIQAKFLRKKSITYVGTKGNSNRWVSQYRVLYSIDGSDWTAVKDIGGNDMIFNGNYDSDTLIVNRLPYNVEAKYIRINPVEWRSRIEMKFDVQGCNVTDICQSEPCQNGGTCESCIGCENGYVCHCPLSFAGTICEKDIAECSASLVEDVQDAQITSSSNMNDISGPDKARLSSSEGSWISQHNDENQFIQVKFLRIKSITSVATKGLSNQWVSQYRVLFSLDGSDWTVVKDIFDSETFSGNTDDDTLIVNRLPYKVEAKYLRINPVEWRSRISMQFDVQGCYDTDVCNSEPCQNGGTCDSCIGCEVDYNCHCPLPFTGRNCEKDIAECSAWLVEDLRDFQITSSTQHSDNYGPDKARLSTVAVNNVGGAWLSQINNGDQFIQARFIRKMSITSIATKGRPEQDQWVTQYRVLYSIDDIEWAAVKDISDSDMIFNGNTDRDSVVVNQLSNTVEAKYIRINPIAWRGRIAMRFDIQGCNGTDVCNSEPCQNGGICESCFGCEVDYICHCPLFFTGTRCEKDIAECSAWLVEDVQDAQITSSSNVNDNYGPDRARLSSVVENNLGGAWSSQHNNDDQFIQVAFFSTKSITSVATKGRSDQDHWVTQYRVLYSLDGIKWTVVNVIGGSDAIFIGNTDRDTLVVNRLPHTVEAKYVKINPLAWKTRIALRFDVQGCEGEEDVCDSEVPSDVCQYIKCEKGGTCVPCSDCELPYACICQQGRLGLHCEFDVCQSVECGNGGECAACSDCDLPFKCTCPEGRFGLNCEFDICQDVKCKKGGTCVSCSDCELQYRCICVEGRLGLHCEFDGIPDPIVKKCQSTKKKEKICNVRQTNEEQGYIITNLTLHDSTEQKFKERCIENETYFIHELKKIRATKGCKANFVVTFGIP